jgi:hypothetical protein
VASESAIAYRLQKFAHIGVARVALNQGRHQAHTSLMRQLSSAVHDGVRLDYKMPACQWSKTLVIYRRSLAKSTEGEEHGKLPVQASRMVVSNFGEHVKKIDHPVACILSVLSSRILNSSYSFALHVVRHGD